MKGREVKRTNKDRVELTNGKVSLHLTVPIAKFAFRRAATEFDGNVSMYIRRLIECDKAIGVIKKP